MKITLPDIKLQERLLGAVLSFGLCQDMITGGLWIFSPTSVTGRIARLSIYPEAIAWTWFGLAFLTMPYFLLQMFCIGENYAAVSKRLACRAILASGVIWCYLAFLSKGLDYAFVTSIFIFTGLSCIAMSLVLALGLNQAQGQARIDAEAQRQAREDAV